MLSIVQIYANPNGKMNGVARWLLVMILINPSLDCKNELEKIITDKNGSFIIQKISLDEQAIILGNIYAPNDANQQVAFFSKLNHLLQEFSHDNIIIGGDLNCALSPKDKLGGTPVTRKASVIKEIENLCESHNLHDIWLPLNPDLSRFTWRNKSLKIQCRLDFFVISDDLCNLSKKCEILLAPESDHSAVSIHIQSDSLAQKKAPVSGSLTLRFLKMKFILLPYRKTFRNIKKNTLT